jgi:delta 1-pyrroline-5-carboxylate dehydrogenase
MPVAIGSAFGAVAGRCSALLVLGRQCDKAGVTIFGDMLAGKREIE